MSDRDYVVELEEAIDEMETVLREAQKALEPFANLVGYYPTFFDSEEIILSRGPVPTVGNLRAAKRTYDAIDLIL